MPLAPVGHVLELFPQAAHDCLQERVTSFAGVRPAPPGTDLVHFGKAFYSGTSGRTGDRLVSQARLLFSDPGEPDQKHFLVHRLKVALRAALTLV
jgi:hypothetical protein